MHLNAATRHKSLVPTSTKGLALNSLVQFLTSQRSLMWSLGISGVKNTKTLLAGRITSDIPPLIKTKHPSHGGNQGTVSSENNLIIFH